MEKNTKMEKSVKNKSRKKVTKKRKINYQKIFCFASFIFIIVCILWYGGRFVYFYLDSKKTITEEATTLARILKTENHDQETFKQINQSYYFYGNATNNYVKYSNLLWRVVKINKDNSVELVNDSVIGTLAYGDKNDEYKDSNILRWLNVHQEEANSGKLENALNEKDTYLVKSGTCIDTVSDLEKISCENVEDDFYIGLLSIEDYIHTGGSKSFVNNGRETFLANQNEKNEMWYVTAEGKLDTAEEDEILGIKATVTLSPTLELKKGTGTQEDPYQIEENTALFGSYVKLGEDIWRVYEENNDMVKLILQDTLKDEKQGTNKFKYSYSKNSYYHNDTIYGSLAYYLNHTYYNRLSYKELIVENTYANGFYTSDNNYLYQSMEEKTIETRVAVPSMGDILLDDTLDDYFTDTGLSEESSLVYLRKKNGGISSKKTTSEASIVPCISIRKENLKGGSGSMNDPYRTE